MLFNSLDFLAFFAVFFSAFAVAPAPARRWVLLAGSLAFYGFYDVRILTLLVMTTWITHRLVLRMAETASVVSRRKLMYSAVGISIAFLLFFKYFMFVGKGISRVVMAGGGSGFTVPEILLPAGISFYTFQLISYCVDVYRKEAAPQESFPDLLLFITYFPKLVAGPLERAKRFMPLLRDTTLPGERALLSGTLLAFWGLFKKVFIADNLSPIVDVVLDPGVHPPAAAVSLAAYAFAIQIYADFSGYTDIARGISRMLGIELTLNFNLPVLSSNPAEIWRRWHITVGAFFRDYIYIPLGGSRMGFFRQGLNIIIVWFLGGLWHGASLGFTIWGLYCGVLIVVYNALSPALGRLGASSRGMDRALTLLGRIFTVTAFAHGLLLFRVESPAHLLRLWNGIIAWGDPVVSLELVLRVFLYTLPLAWITIIQAMRGKLEIWEDWHWARTGAVLSLGVLLFVLFGSFRSEKFFYFQF
ncbi:MAG: MBOAT family protein [Spirochaetia bacterium]|nr:MBOAT family protein [Spirochaetia bacterium]